MFVSPYKASPLRLAFVFLERRLGVPGACLGVPVIEMVFSLDVTPDSICPTHGIELTINCYTDPALLDVTVAVRSLPDFSSGQSDTSSRAAKGA